MCRVLNVLRCAGAVVVALMVSTVVLLWLAVVGAAALVWRALPWVVGAAALVIIVLRVMDISESEYGLWQEYPHSGFTPDCPTWEGGEW